MAWRCRFLTARTSHDGRVIAEHPTHWLIPTQAWRDPERAFAPVFVVVRGEDACPVSGVGEGVLRLPRAAEAAQVISLAAAAEVLLERVLVETSITLFRPE